jgi:hypothetical protein
MSNVITPSGTLSKQINIDLSGVISMHSARTTYGSGASYNISLDGLIAPLGAIAKRIGKGLAGVIVPSSSGAAEIIKNYVLALSGAIAPVGALAKRNLVAFSGSLVPVGSAIVGGVQKITELVVGGIIQPAGALLKATGKSVAGMLTPIKGFARSVVAFREFSGTITPSAILDVLKARAIYLSGMILPSSMLTKTIGKNFVGSITAPGVLIKSIARTLTGIIASAGVLARRYLGVNVGARTSSVVPLHGADNRPSALSGSDNRHVHLRGK